MTRRNIVGATVVNILVAVEFTAIGHFPHGWRLTVSLGVILISVLYGWYEWMRATQ